MPLSDAAKAEITDAIRIVREDRFEQYARTTIGKHVPKETPPPKEDEIIVPEKDKVDPPPGKEKEKEELPPKRADRWWGEIED